MAVKFDLEKAYDKLSWEFILDMLRNIGIPDSLVLLIIRYITTSSMRVLWNGASMEKFHPSCGIRQRDPLSLYIFIICVERLAHQINGEVEDGNWKAIRIARKFHPLSYYFFTYDIILFVEASVKYAKIIRRVLEGFC